MLLVGLTGSIGMGKSTTAEMFRREGIPVHDSDRAVHELYESDALEPIRAAFPGVVGSGGVDRGLLAKRVFGDQQALERLEQIVHPLVSRRRDDFLAAARTMGFPLCIVEIPLLYETGADCWLDVVAVVTADPAVQKQRVMARPGMTQEKFAAILSRQISDAEKRRRAHWLIDTSRGLEAARRQATDFLRALRR